MARLRPVPDHPPRAVLYLRQSVSRDDSISLELQEAAGRTYCLQKGYQVVGVEADPGISGRTWNRPAVVRTMQMIEDGDADVVVLWKWSRLSRSRRDWAIAADRVDVAGGRIESATEDVDVSTATGRLARGMLVEFAAFESDRVGDVWREVHSSRLAEGKTPSGTAKTGYVWNRAEQVHEPDPVLGPVIAELYERYVAGMTFLALVSDLNERGIRTARGNWWTSSGLRRVMDAGFAAGFIPWRKELHPGRHTPLISPELWQRYQDARTLRRSTPPRAAGSRYLLTGLLTCGKCGGPMTGNPGNARGSSYRCGRRKTQGPAACSVTSVSTRVVESRLLGWVSSVAADVESSASLMAEAEASKLSAQAEVSRLGAELDRLEKAMRRLTVQVAEGLVPEAAYAGAWLDLEVKQRSVQARMETQARLMRAKSADLGSVAAGLVEEWDELPLSEKRELLRSLVDGIRATSGGEFVDGHQGKRSAALVEVLPSGSNEWLIA